MDCLGKREKTTVIVIAAGFGAGWDHINPTLFDAGHAVDISVKGIDMTQAGRKDYILATVVSGPLGVFPQISNLFSILIWILYYCCMSLVNLWLLPALRSNYIFVCSMAHGWWQSATNYGYHPVVFKDGWRRT